MLIDIACLQGDHNNIGATNVLGIDSKFQAESIDDIFARLAMFYAMENSPYPIIGNVEATKNGLIIPSIGDCFFWITVHDEGTIMLSDFGSDQVNRIGALNDVCKTKMIQNYDIWSYYNDWQLTYHNTTSERLVAYYVSFVTSYLSEPKYISWLKASPVVVNAPFYNVSGEKTYIGLDLSSADTSSSVKGYLETKLYNHIKQYDRQTQNTVKVFVQHFMERVNIPLNAKIESSGPYVHANVDTIAKQLIKYYK